MGSVWNGYVLVCENFDVGIFFLERKIVLGLLLEIDCRWVFEFIISLD